MKTVLIMRHAEAQAEDSSQTDFARQLTPEGEIMAIQTGSLLKQLNIPVHRVIASAAPRTTRTAQLVASQACPTAPLLSLRELYAAPADQLAQTLLRHSFPDEDSILLVAHNPGIAELICDWSGQYHAVPPATVLVLTVNTDDWQEFHSAPIDSIRLIRYATVQQLDIGNET